MQVEDRVKILIVIMLWATNLLSTTAIAHKPSDSYMTLDVTGPSTWLRWDIALRDLEYAIGIDLDGDRTISWGEVQQRYPRIIAFAQRQIELSASGSLCTTTPREQQLADHTDGTYAAMIFDVHCTAGGVDGLRYDLLFDRDPTHRGLLNLRLPEGEQLYTLSPEQREIAFDTSAPVSPMTTFVNRITEGTKHILSGPDHVLFLITLILAAVPLRSTRVPHPVSQIRGLVKELLLITGAFTLAHSLTLPITLFDLVTLPGRWVESAIALSILLAAVNNLYPFLPGRSWAIAFSLGLVHGLGFASDLAGLTLSTESALLALAGFNLGIELGQLALAMVLVPPLYLYRNTHLYRILALRGVSAVIAIIALVWLVERGFDIRLTTL
ncbi:MAG: HupE/UreJ family protein [Candidatus Thiodiazotropha sp.]